MPFAVQVSQEVERSEKRTGNCAGQKGRHSLPIPNFARSPALPAESTNEAADQHRELLGERHLVRRRTAIKRNVVRPGVTLQPVGDLGLKQKVLGVPEQDADTTGDQQRGLDDLP